MKESAVRSARKLPPSTAALVVDTDMGKCKTPGGHREVKSAIRLWSGILICTVVLFVLVSLDPSRVSEDPRLLVTFPYTIRSHAVVVAGSDRRLGDGSGEGPQEEVGSPALDGMGVLLRKGTRAMPELVVAHLSESTTAEDLKWFLRGLHRSGMPARADVVVLFPWRPLPLEFATVIRHEDQYFRRLLAKTRKGGGGSPGKLSVFTPGAYTGRPFEADFGKGRPESIWGRSVGNGSVGSDGEGNSGSDETAHYGAIVGFDMQELDPDDALSGFLDSPPANLRRWVCYQILLGMVRHRYPHVLLTEVTGVFILKDILAPLQKKDTSLHLYYTGQRWNDPESPPRQNNNATLPEATAIAPVSVMESVYGKSFWNSLDDDDKTRKVISTGVIVGGIRDIRSVAMAMATEIVRVALLRKDRRAFGVDSPILSFLVHKSSVLGKKVVSHLHVHESGAYTFTLLPGPPRVSPSPSDECFPSSDSRFAVLQGLQSNAVPQERRGQILETLRKDICNSQNDTEIYTDCFSVIADQTDSKTVS